MTCDDLIYELKSEQRAIDTLMDAMAKHQGNLNCLFRQLEGTLRSLPDDTAIVAHGTVYRLVNGRVVSQEIRYGHNVIVPLTHIGAGCGCPTCLEDAAEVDALGDSILPCDRLGGDAHLVAAASPKAEPYPSERIARADDEIDF